MFDRKQIIITSANFSKNGILDKRQMEIGVLIDISTTGEEFVETLNDCILMKNQEKVRQALKDARKKAERIEVSQEVKENKNKRHQLSEEKIKAIKDIIKENILKKDENEQNELGIMFEGQEKIKKN
jgi:TPP-dependent indolepyruvate ferredoxin oxidoreductase alpha subunit